MHKDLFLCKNIPCGLPAFFYFNSSCLEISKLLVIQTSPAHLKKELYAEKILIHG